MENMKNTNNIDNIDNIDNNDNVNNNDLCIIVDGKSGLIKPLSEVSAMSNEINKVIDIFNTIFPLMINYFFSENPFTNTPKKKLKVIKNDVNAKLPKRATDGSIGYDLYSLNNIIINPNETKRVDTGVSIEIPGGQYGRIAEKSGLGLKGITVVGGVIDRDYRGPLMALLRNVNDTPYAFKKGEKCAQLIIESAVMLDVEEYKNIKDLTETERGDGGFGSTGAE